MIPLSSLLLSSQKDFLPLVESSLLPRPSINWRMPINSLISIPPSQSEIPDDDESSVKEPSLKQLEDVYNFNKSIKDNNAAKIEKMTLPSISMINNNSPSSSTLGQRRESRFLANMKFSNMRRESIQSQATSKISIKYKIRNRSKTSNECYMETLKRILNVEPKERDEEEIRCLVEILSKMEFFQTLGVQHEVKLIETCCRNISMEFVEKNQYVFLYGSQGSKFYIILQGTVGVWIPKSGGMVGSEEFREIKILKSGDAFGELALISKKNRAASILCREDSYFAVLDKKHFLEILCIFFIGGALILKKKNS